MKGLIVAKSKDKNLVNSGQDGFEDDGHKNCEDGGEDGCEEGVEDDGKVE